MPVDSMPLTNKITAYLEIIRQLQELASNEDTATPIHKLLVDHIADYLNKISAQAFFVKDEEY